MTADARIVVVGPPVWFVTGPSTVEDLTSPSPRIADLVVHAKTMGTAFTACGRDTTTWAKLWVTPFEAASPTHQCQACAALTRRMSGAAGRNAHQSPAP